MRNAGILRLLVAAALALVATWVVRNSRWVEVEIVDPPSGRAATDPYYALRAVLAAGGSTLESRGTLEPLPPTGATLVLSSFFWDTFPERDALLKTWVENGGHLVVLNVRSGARQSAALSWIPLSVNPLPDLTLAARQAAAAARASAAAAASAAASAGAKPSAPAGTTSAPGTGSTANDADSDKDDSDDDAPRPHVPAVDPDKGCTTFRETPETLQPSDGPARDLRACMNAYQRIYPLGVVPTWQLANAHGTLALRVPVGRGSVTGVPSGLPLDNYTLLRVHTALAVSAILVTRPGQPVWIVDDERGEPLKSWLWHHARTPLLLGLAAIALAVWRLMVRFGPRQARPAEGRRSMGEQTRGTGEFIASHDPAPLHAATRQALADAARARIAGWDDLDDSGCATAIAAWLAPAVAIDTAALRTALSHAPRKQRARWLADIAVLEQARRALLQAGAPPLS